MCDMLVKMLERKERKKKERKIGWMQEALAHRIARCAILIFTQIVVCIFLDWMDRYKVVPVEQLNCNNENALAIVCISLLDFGFLPLSMCIASEHTLTHLNEHCIKIRMTCMDSLLYGYGYCSCPIVIAIVIAIAIHVCPM